MAESTSAEEHPRKRIKIDESDNAVPISTTDSQAQKELDAGITQFISLGVPGFSGVLKQRYTDFLVNEILSNGEVLHLTDLNVPPKLSNSRDEQEQQTDAQNGRGPPTEGKPSDSGKPNAQDFELSEENRHTLDSLFGEETTQALHSIYKRMLANPEKKPRDFKSVASKEPIKDREKRTSAHQALRQIFDGKFESNTEKDGTIVISAAARANRHARGSAPGRVKGKVGWDQLGGEFLHFSLYKENKDTMEVLGFLGSLLKVAPKNFQFSGTKDRRAVTVQRVSAFRVQATRLAQVNRQLFAAQLGDYEYQQSGLELGQAAGNEFVITLRNCHFPGEEDMDHSQRLNHGRSVVAQSVDAFRRDGFLNYFGLQRFGSFANSTSSVGTKLLQGDYKAAVDLILEYTPAALAAAQESDSSSNGEKPSVLISRDDKARALAIHRFREDPMSSQEALKALPRKFSAESNIIRHLSFLDKRTGCLTRMNDYQGAISHIPRNLRLMYTHAYQSLVWNTVAGERWSSYGANVVEGDLVLVHEHRDKEPEGSTLLPEESGVDESGEVIIVPPTAASTADDPFIRARALSAEEAASGSYTIWDVVLPLPGYDVLYPANRLGEFYKEFMASEAGGGIDPLDMRRKQKDMSLSGGYRKLLSRPNDGMDFEVHEYVHDTDQLVKTDMDKINDAVKEKGRANAEKPAPDSQDVKMDEASNETKPTKDTDYKIAVVLRFQLGTSQYATMALRELMKKGGVKEHVPAYGGR